MWPLWSCEKHHAPTHAPLWIVRTTRTHVPESFSVFDCFAQTPWHTWKTYTAFVVSTEGLHSTSTVAVWWFPAPWKLCSSLGVIIRYLWLKLGQKCETTQQIISGSGGSTFQMAKRLHPPFGLRTLPMFSGSSSQFLLRGSFKFGNDLLLPRQDLRKTSWGNSLELAV